MKRLLVAVVLTAMAFVWSSADLLPLVRTEKANALPSASGALSPNPPNNTFTRGKSVVSAPSNWDFENGLTDWSTSCASSSSGGQSGNYLSMGCGANAYSSPFTVASNASTFTFYLTGGDYAVVYVATSPYTNWDQRFFGTGNGSWVAKTMNLSSYAGQTIKVRYRTLGWNGFDEGAGRDEVPQWTASGAPTWSAALAVPATTASVGDYSTSCTGAAVAAITSTGTTLNGNDAITSSPFTVPGDAGRISFHFYGAGNPSASISLYLASESYATPHVLFNKSFSNGQGVYTSCDISAYAGQKAKVKIASSAGGSTHVINGGQTSSFNAMLDEAMDEVSVVSGVPEQKYTDIAVPGKGVALDFTRSYAPTGALVAGSLGWGWTHSYDTRLTINNDGSVQVKYPQGPNALFKNVSGTLTAPQGNTDTLVKNGDNTYTLTTKSHVRMNFGTAGQLANFKDRNNNTTTVAYSGNNLSSVTDPGGRTFTFTVDGSGRITQIAAPLSRTVGFAYDSNGDLVTVTDVKGGTITYAYSNHRLKTVTDQLNHVQLTLTYDDANRVVEHKNAVNSITCYYYGSAPSYTSANCAGAPSGYAPSEGETTKVDPRGNAEKTQYDSSFRPTGVKDALGNETTYTYETAGSLCSPANNGNKCSVTDPLSHTTSFTYDAKRNLLTKTDADSKTWTYTYNSFNDPLTQTDPLTRVTTNVYDTSGNLTSTANALSHTTTFSPNTDGTLASVTDPLSHTTSFTYDTYGNQLTKTDALSHTWTGTYDLGGRILTVTDPLSHATTYTYDNMGKMLTVTDALSNATTAVYNAKGLQTSLTDANSKQTTFVYDAADRVTTVTDPLSQTITTSYDANGNRTSFTNVRGKSTTYVYDALNRVTSMTEPLSRTTSYTYDAAGRRTSKTDAKSQTINYSYDVVNRLTTIDYPTGTSDVSFTYNALGNGLSMVDGTGTTTFTLDALYRPTSIQDGASATIGYAYDNAGRRTSITYPGSTGSVSYGYDNADRLTSVTDFQSKTTSYTYDNANRLTSSTLGNGLISDRTYDNADRLLTVVNRNGGTTISSYTYTLDAVGNRSQVVDTSGTATYTYDNLYRLTGVTYPNSDTQSYTYDANGNRLTKVHNSVTTSYTYDDLDEMTVAGGVTHTYDNNGNQTGAGSNSWSWDAQNRLTAATLGGVSSSYAYNGAGLRTSRTVGGTTVGYTWDLTGSQPNVLQDSTGNKYVYGLDLISRTDNGGSQEYYLYDGLGSSTGLASGTGTVTDSFTYDVFGALRSHTGSSTNEYTFTGEQNDPTGQEYLRARYYDAGTGRFIGRDPLPFMQRYSYVDGNPITRTDPTGLTWEALASVLEAAGDLRGAAILRDPCWRTHAFCATPPFKAIGRKVISGVKAAAEAVCPDKYTCAENIAFGMIVVGTVFFPGTPAIALAGAALMFSVHSSQCAQGSGGACVAAVIDGVTLGAGSAQYTGISRVASSMGGRAPSFMTRAANGNISLPGYAGAIVRHYQGSAANGAYNIAGNPWTSVGIGMSDYIFAYSRN